MYGSFDRDDDAPCILKLEQAIDTLDPLQSKQMHRWLL